MPYSSSERNGYYHTPDDKVENVDKKMIKAAMEIGYNFIMQEDKYFQSVQYILV